MAGEQKVQVSHFLDKYRLGSFQIKLLGWSVLIGSEVERIVRIVRACVWSPPTPAEARKIIGRPAMSAAA